MICGASCALKSGFHSAGLATQAVPLYLSEIAPVQIRGQLNIMFQLSITIGILVAQIINYCECIAVANCSTPVLTMLKA